MQDTYQSSFKSFILQGKESCVMYSYNDANIIPACAHHKLSQKTRTEWVSYTEYLMYKCYGLRLEHDLDKIFEFWEFIIHTVCNSRSVIHCTSYYRVLGCSLHIE